MAESSDRGSTTLAVIPPRTSESSDERCRARGVTAPFARRVDLVNGWMRQLTAAALVACLVWTSALAITKHDHQGIIPSYDGAPPEIALSVLEYDAVEEGQAVHKAIDVNGMVGAAAVFRVNAPPEMVWATISDFRNYPAWIDGLVETKVYLREGDDVYVKFRYQHWLAGEYTYYIRHTYPGESTGWGTWRLDYGRRSDLDDSVGFWRVDSVPGDPRRSDVTYFTDVRLKGWLAALARDAMVTSALDTATGWVKKQSELRFLTYSRR